jgi:uncharacterized protein (DUF488 family)
MTTIYTIGHSNVPASRIVTLLQEHQIQAVVDVRSSPYSRFSPQFNKKVLSETLPAAGIEYQFAGDQLGGRPQDPTCYSGGLLPQNKADYARLLDHGAVTTKPFFLAGIQHLLELAATRRTAILCSEADPDKCHRNHLIGKYLEGQGVEVVHIRIPGNQPAGEQ